MYMVENPLAMVDFVTGSTHSTRSLISTRSSLSTMRCINFSLPFLETYRMTPSVWMGSCDTGFVAFVLKCVMGRIGVVRKSLRFISICAKTVKV